jgi:hypothetical protein
MPSTTADTDPLLSFGVRDLLSSDMYKEDCSNGLFVENGLGEPSPNQEALIHIIDPSSRRGSFISTLVNTYNGPRTMATNPTVALLNILWKIRENIWKLLKSNDVKISASKSSRSSTLLDQDGVPANQWKDSLLKDLIPCAPLLLVKSPSESRMPQYPPAEASACSSTITKAWTGASQI